LIKSVEQLAERQGLVGACSALSVPRSSFYRALASEGETKAQKATLRPPSARALSEAEKEKVRTVLNSAPYQNLAPREVYADLLDQGVYLCSWRTMYRILDEHGEVKERRNQLRHPTYQRPELLATQPNQVWSWDITKLRGSEKLVYYYLYVMLDLFSRYVVGWMIAERESAELAEQLITESCRKQAIQHQQLTIHADNGGAMRAKTVSQLMSELGIQPSHSRPHVSNDNPFSEAHFKTLKYAPDFPGEFASLATARQWAQPFFDWYNHEHHHTGIALFTPADVHYGRSEQIRQLRQEVMQQAYLTHPERFINGSPIVAAPPAAVWINPPLAPTVPIDALPATDSFCATISLPVGG